MSDWVLLFLAHLEVRVKKDRITKLTLCSPPRKEVLRCLYVKDSVKHIQR